ncbi:hypothetical protein [Exiguobacterium sp. UBA5002]|uniref:hypothetical protein n=1 Tax=Exiguobacterium sp. UBA5002 TaxID=1946497 RepID=UPI0025BBC01B|nr:hypothetical protein [Exiguobacterium sp. UBA5002]
MIKLENKGFGQFWITRDAVTYIIGLSEAAKILKCSIDEVRKITFATVELSEVTQ